MYARIATGIMEENQSGKNGDKKIRGDRNGKILGRKNQGGESTNAKEITRVGGRRDTRRRGKNKIWKNRNSQQWGK